MEENQQLREYQSLMSEVSNYCRQIGLEAEGLIKDVCSKQEDRWIISVSWKRLMDNSGILYDPRDEFKTNFQARLKFPSVTGTKTEIESYKRMAETKGAEWFAKKSISFDGFVEPSSDFLAMSRVEQVEYAFHESFHRTPKILGDRKVDHLPFAWEEPHAAVVGYLVAIGYFTGKNEEVQARRHWEKHLGLALKVNQFCQELGEVYSLRLDKDNRPIGIQQTLIDREAVLERARSEMGINLGEPINNAFFLYWNYFYGGLHEAYEKVSHLTNIKDVISTLKELKF